MIRSTWLAVTALIASVALIGCGDDSTTTTTGTPTTPTGSGGGGQGGEGQGGEGQGGNGQGGNGQGGNGQGGNGQGGNGQGGNGQGGNGQGGNGQGGGQGGGGQGGGGQGGEGGGTPFDVCGDGLATGPEACDDGDAMGGDGCDDACQIEPGYTCSGMPSVCTTACGDGILAGTEGCDDADQMSGDGCSATCAVEPGYTCAGSPSVCVQNTGCGNGVVSPGEGCDDGNTVSGDGCNAACAVEGGFTCSGSPSLCCIMESEPNASHMAADGPIPVGAKACGSINPIADDDYFSFTLPTAGDVMIETFGASGSGSCPGGVDTVIYLYGSDGLTLIALNDNKAAGNYCSSISPATTPAAVGLPAGTYYVRVEDWQDDSILFNYVLSVRASVCGNGAVEGSEECDGTPGCSATCQLAAPGPGESLGTAQPFPGCPLAPSSQAREDVPSCFPATGGVHWYSYDAAAGVLSLTANAAGPIALYSATGDELGCSTNATQQPLTTLTGNGGTVYAAVSVPTSITCMTFQVAPYGGLQGTITDLNITFGASPPAFDYGMAVSPTTLYIATPLAAYHFPKTGNAAAVEHASNDGLGIAHLGYDLHFANGNLISVDNNVATSTSRVWRIFDQAANDWGPTAWDLAPAYPAASGFYSVTYDGTSMISATRNVDGQVHFFSYSATMPSQPVLLGANSTVDYVVGLAADSQYFYVAGRAADGEGVFRISRASIASPATRLAYLNTSTLHNAVEVNNTMNATYLYVREEGGDIHVIMNPGASALHAGPITDLGTASDFAMTYDTTSNVLYFLETETNGGGAPRILRLQ